MSGNLIRYQSIALSPEFLNVSHEVGIFWTPKRSECSLMKYRSYGWRIMRPLEGSAWRVLGKGETSEKSPPVSKRKAFHYLYRTHRGVSCTRYPNRNWNILTFIATWIWPADKTVTPPPTFTSMLTFPVTSKLTSTDDLTYETTVFPTATFLSFSTLQHRLLPLLIQHYICSAGKAEFQSSCRWVATQWRNIISTVWLAPGQGNFMASDAVSSDL